MINQETYDCILEILSREPSFNEGRRHLQAKWPEICETVDEKMLKSIQAQYYVRRMRRCHHHHYITENREKYYKLYKEAKSRNEQNVIMRLAAKNDISPCLLARIILEEYYRKDADQQKDREKGDGRNSLPPGFMTDCIRDIARIPNPELAREIYETMLLDNFYGPAVDSIKKTCGVEYEMILRAHCRKAGLSFIDEDKMREDGYDKTPDVKLTVPCMINNKVVNWIESKASFGDPINHQQYMIDQYLAYKSRFGPGAVIYWFGFVSELAEAGERGILVLTKFPEAEEITLLKDVHKKEADSVGFRNLREKDCDSNYTNDALHKEADKFSDYVDPMFDSDEEDYFCQRVKQDIVKQEHVAVEPSTHSTIQPSCVSQEDVVSDLKVCLDGMSVIDSKEACIDGKGTGKPVAKNADCKQHCQISFEKSDLESVMCGEESDLQSTLDLENALICIESSKSQDGEKKGILSRENVNLGSCNKEQDNKENEGV